MSGGTTDGGLDLVRRQVMWNRLLALVEEQAQAVMRTAFCTIVRESGDLSAGIFDPDGRLLAQAQTGTPGFIHTLAGVVSEILKDFPAGDMTEGDAFVTNDPWLNCGHLHDFSVVTPVFREGRVVAFVAAAAHVVDAGGRGLGPDGRQIYEEGLTVPPLPLFEAGRTNRTLLRILRMNVRAPEQVVGDILSLAATNEKASDRLIAMMDEYGLADLADLADMIIEQSAVAMREAVAAVPDGRYAYTMTIDGYDRPVDLAATMTVTGGEMTVDFDGTSSASPFGINVVLNYSRAYAWFGIKCILAPDVPTNAGSLSNILIDAPENSILNVQRPFPVSARHIVGHMLPDVMFGCLSQALPDACPAESGAALWGPQFRGGPAVVEDANAGRPFEAITVHSGGTGGRPGKDGLSVTAFPTNLRTVPVEMIEATTPLVVWQREYRPDSGGAGTWRGGLGQRVEFGHADGAAFSFAAMFDRGDHPARGRDGGRDGVAGRVALKSGAMLRPKGVQRVPAGDRLVFELPGGGGLGDPAGREPGRLAADRRAGFVSEEAAARDYGIALESDNILSEHRK